MQFMSNFIFIKIDKFIYSIYILFIYSILIILVLNVNNILHYETNLNIFSSNFFFIIFIDTL